jgi:L-ascorbate metabolism protein UlaG (beta-lactamase superfamily)
MIPVTKDPEADFEQAMDTAARPAYSPAFEAAGDCPTSAQMRRLDFDGIRIYHTCDTAYRPERFVPVVEMHPDVVIPCINGRYGNMNAEEAALLTQAINPRVSIPSHFWMFVEYNGDPGLFLESCAKLAPAVQALVMKPGERHLLRRS